MSHATAAERWVMLRPEVAHSLHATGVSLSHSEGYGDDQTYETSQNIYSIGTGELRAPYICLLKHHHT